jgi:hypothetical protein
MVQFGRNGRRAALAAPILMGALALPAAAHAADARVNGSTIELIGFTGSNTYAVTQEVVPGQTVVRFRDTSGGGIAAKSGCERIDSNEAVCRSTASGPTLSLKLGGGNDVAFISASMPTVYQGGDGNDTYQRIGALSRVDFQGGSGFDKVNYSQVPAGVTVVKDNAANDGRPGTDTDNIRPDV